ncbi:DUF6544 family protein [Aquicoccus porphyridii]|uniref:DUF6544 family protein n=1 Tax=Aquicoccus porphyridii TaxID=1852029 RepID=UPI00273D39D9|nr:DUF6544 family protein [Aquicoccus porphyridii]
MMMVVTGIVGGLVALGALHLWAARRFRREAAALVGRVVAGPAPDGIRDDLPQAVAALGLRGTGGNPPLAPALHLTQAAEMTLAPGKGWQPITARQVIGVATPGFVWEAWQMRGPLVSLRVIDSYVEGHGLLAARLMGSVPVARVQGGEMDRGEAMRYLAELPWAPDAILANRAVLWRVLEDGRIEARLAMTPRDAVVCFTLDADGDIVEMNARDRPATGQDGHSTLRDWRGRFHDYGMIGGRRVPLRGEVGYVEGEGFAPYWRGRITGLATDPAM